LEPLVATHLKIDDAAVAAADEIHPLIDPVWWTANFHDTPDAYHESLAGFTRPQRFAWAMVWYLSEVTNGGHDQFYSNATGAVWSDALEGFWDAHLPQISGLILDSADRMGGSPSLDHEERNAFMDAHEPDFADLDAALYAFLDEVDVYEKILDYAKARPGEFHFDGVVMAPPPKPTETTHGR
jgi:hypothetical protein